MKRKTDEVVIRPQEGKQEMFLSSPADICIYGGAAGGGKTYALLLECLRHVDNPQFEAVVFRQSRPQILAAGGLFATSLGIYPHMGANYVLTPNVQWRFQSGAKITFTHMFYEKEKYNFQGSQIPLLMFDELTHFSEAQFFYMLSRNRSTCGVRPYVRATCNPDTDSWVADFIEWWINQETGYAIPERLGVLRYFYRIEGELIWGDSIKELSEKCKNVEGFSPDLCKSVTFIASSVFDNEALLRIDPGYLANLHGLPLVEKERLLMGNWKIRPAAGLYFKHSQTRIVKEVPDKVEVVCRAWDLAATEATHENKSPDRTAGCLMARLQNGQYIILDMKCVAANASHVRELVRNTAITDKAVVGRTRISIPQDPGQAGKEQAESYQKELAGFNVTITPISKDKVLRAEPFAAQWQIGNVLLLEGDWNTKLLDELEGFPDAAHDDQVDACSDAFAIVAKASNAKLPKLDSLLMKDSYWI